MHWTRESPLSLILISQSLMRPIFISFMFGQNVLTNFQKKSLQRLLGLGSVQELETQFGLRFAHLVPSHLLDLHHHVRFPKRDQKSIA